MNYTNSSSRNFFLNGEEYSNMIKILEFAVTYAGKGYKTLILTCRSNLNVTLNQMDQKSHLNRIIIMYFEDIKKMITKILNLHDWSISPNIVVVDLNTVFKNEKDSTSESLNKLNKIPTKKDVCLLISSLLNYIQLMSKKESLITFSITVVDNKCAKNYIQILTDLYFYNSTFSDFVSLRNNLPIV